MDKVLEYFGGAANLARALNVKPPAVSQWIKQGALPPFRAIEVELLTRGEIKAVDITKRGEE